MSGSVFMETLRRHWRQALYWALGLGSYAFLMAWFVRDADVLKQYGDLVQSGTMKSLLQALGMGDAASLATPEGFIGYGFFTYALLILTVYAVMNGLNITANEEDQGIMDVLISLPLPRWRIVAEKFAVYTLGTIIIALVSFLGLWIGTATSPIMKIDAGKLLVGCLNVIPGTLLVLAFTALIATVVRRKGTATAIAAVFVVGSFLVNIIANAASGSTIAALNNLSLFYYYDGTGVLVRGLAWGNVIVLVVVAVVGFVGSLWAFQRRDVGV